MKEYKLLRGLDHKNVLKVKSFIEEKDSLILELCGILRSDLSGNVVIDIKDWAKSSKAKDQVSDFKVIEQILNGLSYLHVKDVIHCDLKSSNCLVTGRMESPIVKLADFGIAYFQTVTQTQISQGSSEKFSNSNMHFHKSLQQHTCNF